MTELLSSLLLPGVSLAACCIALVQIIRQRRRGPTCQHSGWLDLPSSGIRRGTVHEKMMQAFRSLEQQRDAANREADDWASVAAEAANELQALRKHLDFLERQCAEQWETIDSLEREQRRSLEDTWHEWQDDACECIDWDLVRDDDDEV